MRAEWSAHLSNFLSGAGACEVGRSWRENPRHAKTGFRCSMSATKEAPEDDARFDRRGRALLAPITRRAGIAAIRLTSAPLLAESHGASAKPSRNKKKCNPGCPLCQRRVKGRCKARPDGAPAGCAKPASRGSAPEALVPT